MSGLAGLGAAVAIGLLAAATHRPAEHAPSLRPSRSPYSLALVTLATVEGLGILGFVGGLLSVLATRGGHDSGGGVWAVGPPAVGAVIGLTLLVRRHDADRRIQAVGFGLITGLVVLGLVVAQLAVLAPDHGQSTLAGWPIALFGSINALASLGLGLSGARALRLTLGADGQTVQKIYQAQIGRVAVLQTIGVAASIIAIVFILVS